MQLHGLLRDLGRGLAREDACGCDGLGSLQRRCLADAGSVESRTGQCGNRANLLEIDVQGAMQIRFQYPNALLIFVLPPDETTLLQRLRERGRDTEDSIEKRYRGAKREIWMAKGSRAFDDMVINDDIDRVVAEIARLIRHKKSPRGI